jgi:hypothetical protein
VSASLANINAVNNLPTNGIPIALSSGLNVTSGSFTLQYNPSLLNITGVVSKIAGASLTFNQTLISATSATVTLSLSSPSRISSTSSAITIGSLLATVPLSAASFYGAKQLLHFSSEQLNSTAGVGIPVTNEDAVQVVAYLGDVTDSGPPFDLADVTAVSNVASGLASTITQTIPGFAAYPDLDPTIIGDVTLQGSVTFADITKLNQQLTTAQSAIPFAPIGLPITPIGPDPTLSVSAISPDVFAVNIDTGRPEGSTGMMDAVLALCYDPKVFDVSAADVQLGTLPQSGNGWKLQTEVNSETGLIGIELYSSAPIQSTSGGSLVTIALHPRGQPAPAMPASSTAGPAVTIVPYVDPAGSSRVYQTSVSDAAGGFVIEVVNAPPMPGNAIAPEVSLAAVTALGLPSANSVADITGAIAEINPSTLPSSVVEQVFSALEMSVQAGGTALQPSAMLLQELNDPATETIRDQSSAMPALAGSLKLWDGWPAYLGQATPGLLLAVPDGSQAVNALADDGDELSALDAVFAGKLH